MVVAGSALSSSHLSRMQLNHGILPKKPEKDGVLTKASLEKNLQSLDSETLSLMQKGFFQTAQGSTPLLETGKAIPAFFAMSPAQALTSSMYLDNGFFVPSHEPDTQFREPQTGERSKRAETDSAHAKNLTQKFYGAHSKSPGVFSNPSAEKAAHAARAAQAQTQNFLANQLGQSFAQGNMAEFLGPNACFEDVLATVMMNIAAKSEKEMMEQIRVVERGESGLNNLVANSARGLGGIAGGALGGYFGGAQGAAIGQEVGERLVGNYASQNTGSSRQIQFERLKMMIHKQSEMMSAISNILATIHSTNKNTISNIRG